MANVVTIEEAVLCLRKARRIVVIGSSGGGKSTLSRAIADRYGLPLQSLDRDVRWLPGWVERDRAEQRAITTRLVAEERWVMDGTGASSFDIRLPRTDLILWVRLPRWRCLTGVARRVLRYRGTVRPDMAPGCPEPWPDRDFLSYIWNFERTYAPIIVQQIDRHGPTIPVCLLRSRRAMQRLIEG